MNSSRNIKDIRPTSSDSRYAGVIFENVLTGNIDEAIRQAKDSPDYGPGLNARAELESFLNVKRKLPSLHLSQNQSVDRQLTIQDRDSLIPGDYVTAEGYRGNTTLDRALADDVQ